MANLPESSTYDVGVYQLETTDPVVGGADGKSNAAAINLANRTTYLKAHVDALEVVVPQAEAEARTATTRRGWTALRVGQAIAAGITAQVVDATEIIKGIAAIATHQQCNVGEDDARMVTPLKLTDGVEFSTSANEGFIRFPNWSGGFIIQWMIGASGAGGVLTATNPLPFPIALLGGLASEHDPSGEWVAGGATVWAFSHGESNLTTSVARVRNISATGNVTANSGIGGRIFVWGR